jgi:hypothetical protein
VNFNASFVRRSRLSAGAGRRAGERIIRARRDVKRAISAIVGFRFRDNARRDRKGQLSPALHFQGNDYNFDFKLSYKFLKHSEAHLRYGNSSMSTWRGELVNATYCDRVFTRSVILGRLGVANQMLIWPIAAHPISPCP